MVLDLLKKRRSIRRFKPDTVSSADLQTLQEAVLRSPSSRGRNPWEFIFVTDAELRGRLSRAKLHGAEFLAQAPLAVAVIADPKKCDVWIEDCSIAAILLQITAESLGLGSCWAQMRLRDHDAQTSAEDYLRQVLELPPDYRVPFILGIGHPAEAPPGHPREALNWDKIHFNRFGSREEPQP
ncbi:nitroreductase family protein [Geoalkalibacter halelectricus]|uniref:Nitroreductase family protein n=1 Tax=Geoalkalibacter halelectricus TaxID=2847045 RepID=A0ABY5ZRH1_9BACT|nr:nitroreductase family protein [Geoalkalibacter halelectricus]MDO3379973.1 nitroreductase family protein [Geoalkalibacter halelectricus]UWZ80500.1 nitroreductase family protein [Geoalkalibacter halelectricus]